MRLPNVGDHMDLKIHRLKESTDMADAVDYLLQHKITSALVVDDDGKLVGVLSEKDCLKVVVRVSGGDVPMGTVGEYMTREVETIGPNVDVYYVAGMFLKKNFRRFPVVDNGKLVGHITRRDILRIVHGNMTRAKTGDLGLM